MFVAVRSYLPGVTVDADEAEEIATGYLDEIGWFGNGRFRWWQSRMLYETLHDDGERRAPDYVLLPERGKE
jgi:hypothetical protein